MGKKRGKGVDNLGCSKLHTRVRHYLTRGDIRMLSYLPPPLCCVFFSVDNVGHSSLKGELPVC